jgi:hypothetical protein
VEKTAEVLTDSDVKHLDVDRDQRDIYAASSVGGKDNESPTAIIIVKGIRMIIGSH